MKRKRKGREFPALSFSFSVIKIIYNILVFYFNIFTFAGLGLEIFDLKFI